MKCRQCHLPIDSGSYCNAYCRARYNQRRREKTGGQPIGQQRECPICGRPFRTRNSRQLYCCKNCASVPRSARYLAKRRGGPPQTTYVSKALLARRAEAERIKQDREARSRFKPQADPTPEEIAARCLEIPATWSQVDRDARRHGRKDELLRFAKTAPRIERNRHDLPTVSNING